MNKLCDNASLSADAAIHPGSSEIGGKTAPYGDLSLHKVQHQTKDLWNCYFDFPENY